MIHLLHYFFKNPSFKILFTLEEELFQGSFKEAKLILKSIGGLQRPIKTA